MLIRNKKKFALGTGMTIAFFAVLILMFMPIFGGTNAFHAADGLFNSISKASTNYFQGVRDNLAAMEEPGAPAPMELPQEIGDNLVTMLEETGMTASYEDGKLAVEGEMKPLLERIVDDGYAMYQNEGEKLENAYGLEPKVATYAWYNFLKAASKEYGQSRQFEVAKTIDDLNSKTVEVGYNYFGVEPTPISEQIFIVIFALVFYVVYTMWWGYSIFNLFEGFGLLMTKTAKKEG